MTDWTIELHAGFYKDLDRLGKTELKIFNKRRKKIKANPERQKHLGRDRCYCEPITTNIRLIYWVEGARIWFLTIGHHDKAY